MARYGNIVESPPPLPAYLQFVRCSQGARNCQGDGTWRSGPEVVELEDLLEELRNELVEETLGRLNLAGRAKDAAKRPL